MTTTVTISASPDHFVKVQALDDNDGVFIPCVLGVIEPGETGEFHAHSTRQIIISEMTGEEATEFAADLAAEQSRLDLDGEDGA